jgi:hypothetical protein
LAGYFNSSLDDHKRRAFLRGAQTQKQGMKNAGTAHEKTPISVGRKPRRTPDDTAQQAGRFTSRPFS